MATLPRHIGLISQSNDVPFDEVTRVAAALQIQVSRDFEPVWEIKASVAAFQTLDDLPVGTWPVMIVNHVDGAAGIHLDDDGEPFALAEAGPIDEWPLTASHEVLEMLVDPLGRRLTNGASKNGAGTVRYLVEVCDPSEARQFGYDIDGIFVSDFYTPQFFDTQQTPGVRYSFREAVKQPLQVLRGGYLSWFDPGVGGWFQETWFNGPQSVIRQLNLPALPNNANVRWEVKNADVRAGQRATLRVPRAEALVAAAPRQNLWPQAQARRAQMLSRAAQSVIAASPAAGG